METLWKQNLMKTPVESPDGNIHGNTWRRDGNSGGNKMVDPLSIRRGQGFRVESNLWLVDPRTLTRDIQFHSEMSAL